QLRAPLGNGVEARDVCAALPSGVWIVQPVVIHEIICRKGAPARRSIHPDRAFVVPKRLVLRRRGENRRALIGLRDVLQQCTRGRGPCALRYLRIGKNTLRSARASRKIILFAGTYAVAQLLPQQPRKIRPADASRQGTRPVGEVA